MSRRVLLPLLLAAVAAGYAAGVILTPRWVDRGAASARSRARADGARDELKALEALRDPAERARSRAAFLERYPDTWLRGRWAAQGPR